MTTSPEQSQRLARQVILPQVFTPSRPVSAEACFAGRHRQISQCIEALFQSGLHIAVYGERGVGKTSLANVLPQLIEDSQLPNLKAIRVDCSTNDDFESLWRKILRERNRKVVADNEVVFDPEGVRFYLEDHPSPVRLLVIDEFDRLADDEALSLLADTVKTFSDHMLEVTLMFVGVADTVEHLVGEHASIARSLAQISLPRMSEAELHDILSRGETRIGMTIEADARRTIVGLSEGLPHFVHLLALDAFRRAIEDDRDSVTALDVSNALTLATQTHTLMSEYSKATTSPQKDHLFEQVLLACSLAPKDEFGYFHAGDVREPLSRILNKAVPIALFTRHLKEFCGERRGCVLQKKGEPRHYLYRFRDPLLQPFARMVAVATGRLQPPVNTDASDLPFPPSEH